MKSLWKANPDGFKRGRFSVVSTSGAAIAASVLLATVFTPTASAASKIELGTAAPFAVLAGTAITDVPTSAITGDVGLSPHPGSDYAGLTQSEVTGTIYAVDVTGPGGSVNDPALLTGAKNDLTTAFVNAAGLTPTQTFVTGDNQLGGKTLTPGVYAFGHAATANITAAKPLILDGQGDPNSVFVFQASSDLVTASGSVVQLENSAQACNVFWEVDSSATLNSSSAFVGTIMALTSITLATGATVQGRVLARNGDVTLEKNTITAPTTCATSSTTSTTTSTGTGGTGVSTGTGAVPLGFPHTGHGGASLSHNGWLVITGALALAGSGVAAGFAVRRRRTLSVVGNPVEDE